MNIFILKQKKKLNKISSNNNNIYNINARKINLSLPKSIYTNNKYFSLKRNKLNTNNNVKKQSNFETNEYSNDNKNENTFLDNNKKICKENNIFIEQKIIKNIEDKNTSIESIYKLWDYLCVPYSYRELFNVILRQLDEEEKNKIIEN